VATFVPVFLGGLLRWWLERGASDDEDRERRRDQGILFGSGLVGGEGLLGVGIAIAAGYAASKGVEPWGIGENWSGGFAPWGALVVFLLLVALFRQLSISRSED
jgi:hypothetical protein